MKSLDLSDQCLSLSEGTRLVLQMLPPDSTIKPVYAYQDLYTQPFAKPE